MAANPATTVKFTNFSGETLKQNAVNIWDGPPTSSVPLVIEGKTVFTQTGSVVGIEYKFKDNYTLIVAWINNGVENKVYAQILPPGAGTHSVQWAQIKEHLGSSGCNYDTDNQHGYECNLKIEPIGDTPQITAIFTRAS